MSARPATESATETPSSALVPGVWAYGSRSPEAT